MKIVFELRGVGTGQLKKYFKTAETYALFRDYLKRIEPMSKVEAAGDMGTKKLPGNTLWLCDLSPKAKVLSSEELAQKVQSLQNNSVKEWRILIGPPDGFSKEDRQMLNPDFVWSFGPQTLPHDLAAVIAVEQVYRAFTILNRLPYHLGH